MERLTIPDKKIEGGWRRAIIDSREVRKEAMTIYWALKKYEDTGLTPEQVRELAEKQKPMKVEKLKSAQYPYRCPTCGYLLEIGYKHCISCGQRLEYEKEVDHE